MILFVILSIVWSILLHDIDEIQITFLSQADAVLSSVIQQIIEAYKKEKH